MTKKILIIGGGINGAGMARDAAMRGFDVTLFDKGDFGSGTSWTSSKLIHGGLRYLEHFEFGLVRESLREREILLRISPHNVHSLDLTIPVYKHSPHALMTLRAGLTAYDVLSYDKSLPNHVVLNSNELIQKFPFINHNDLLGGLSYSDCQCPFPEKLVLNNLQSSVRHGAKILNYHKVIEILKERGCVTGLRVRNLQTQQESVFKADMVINAAGPWVDEVLQLKSSNERLIGGTKGSHIVVKKFDPTMTSAVYVNARSDGRPFFILPWQDEYLLIGTTDIRFEGDLETLRPNIEEIEYLLAEFNELFPTVKLDRASIVFSFSGVRPLPYTREDAPSAITRKHFIVDHAQRDGIKGLVSLVGGKLTTYRQASEEMIDFVAEQLGQSSSCRTADELLPGGDLENIEFYRRLEFDRLPAQVKISERSFFHLINLYGSKYEKIIELCTTNPELCDTVCSHVPDIKAQLVYAAKNEWVVALNDVLLRRTSAGLGECVGLCNLDGTAELIGRMLNWNTAKINAEKAAYNNYVEEFLMDHQ
ncbi:glycerol-3-phosphate dehydrogenase [bacterium]|nr:glycerol-3-phosphate dehydrogenase [bacterium]